MHFSCSLIKLLITSVECEWRLWGTTVRLNILINFPQIGLVSFYCFAIRFVFHRLRLFSLALTHTQQLSIGFSRNNGLCVCRCVGGCHCVLLLLVRSRICLFLCYCQSARERVGETHYTYLYMYTYLLLQLLRIFHFTNEIQYKQYH